MESGIERLRTWLERSQLTQTEAADLMGIDATQLSRILNGVRRPGLDMAIQIEHTTGIPAGVWVRHKRRKVGRISTAVLENRP